ncbi:type II toxin-antitoxin system ParD family antitoxin [Methylopila musalis]|uniref:Type II toxin-antitoxin system ParD family antitoxin n=1 Tax=Methylopila musalis TaxID=1134781 RepID=A0ABW3ZBM5_9HYPH
MPTDFALGAYFDKLIEALVRSGRYRDASEVVRDALRGLEDRERRRIRDQDELEAFLAGSLDDVEQGRVFSADQVLAEALADIERVRSASAAE